MQSHLRKLCCRYNELAKSKAVRVDSNMYYCFDVRHCGYSQVTDSNVKVTKVWRLRKNGSVVTSHFTWNSPYLESVPISFFLSICVWFCVTEYICSVNTQACLLNSNPILRKALEMSWLMSWQCVMVLLLFQYPSVSRATAASSFLMQKMLSVVPELNRVTFSSPFLPFFLRY